MNRLLSSIKQQTVPFTPYLSKEIELLNSPFKQNQGKLADFVEELYATAYFLEQQQDTLYAEIVATRLIMQFDALQQAVKKIEKNASEPKLFRSSYRFSQNTHNLPKEKRLTEYKKALRALNEKLAWLTERSYLAQNEQQKQHYLAQIQETEYRKQKCLQAIEDIE